MERRTHEADQHTARRLMVAAGALVVGSFLGYGVAKRVINGDTARTANPITWVSSPISTLVQRMRP